MGMQNRLDYHLIDFDNHYYETHDCFSRHIEPRYRDLALRLVEVDGAERWMLGDQPVSSLNFDPMSFMPAPGELVKMFAEGQALQFNDLVIIDPREHPAFMERGARLQRLDEQGVEAAVLLPSLGLHTEYDFRHTPGPLCANFRSFNRWLEEEWGYGKDGRIFGVPMMTLLDVEWAIEELERVVDLGARFVFLKNAPVNDRSPADPVFDPWWARVQEMGVRPIFHLGFEGFNDMYGSHWSEPADRPVMSWSAFQECVCWTERTITDTMAALVLHNLFGRFPGIQALSIENGSSWVGPLLTRMDKCARIRAFGPWLGGPLTERPSDIFRQHIYVDPYPEDDIQVLVKLIGADRVLFGSDYPHPEGLAEPRTFADHLIGLTDTETRMIMRDNGASLLGLAP
jgi:predicted TIM-barrel fold metal-dependent hydrolase